MMYFRVVVDPTEVRRWYLDEPTTSDGQHIDARQFVRGVAYVGPMPCHVPVQVPGEPLAVNLAAFDMPVFSREAAQIAEQIAPDEIERFPVLVDLRDGGYEIVNVKCSAACLDEHQSEVMRWHATNGRPDKAGQYRMVTKLMIDPARAGGLDIFRIRGWEIALIVSDRLRRALCGVPRLGVSFLPVEI